MYAAMMARLFVNEHVEKEGRELMARMCMKNLERWQSLKYGFDFIR